ncbi:hypothetical protein DFP72DRAFT_1033376 [Ephemerocybe angulata]|uniref:Uncharacterized protein n=1 Tax=Ephemerocybe angulata TaxID=980116 RepID=A0A8H6M5W7_9AGAR|nr:hypothetical protein DFP72DRAFT_1033376 [Tulosesus angulatus]
MHMHYDPEPHISSRASSSHSERGEKKKSSSSSSSASTHSGKSTSSSSNTSVSTSSESTTRTKREREHRMSITSKGTAATSVISTASTSPSNSNSATPITPKAKDNNQVLSALRQVGGERVRHSKCPPEYLEGRAHRQEENVQILTGNEASSFFVKYLGGHLDIEARSTQSHGSIESKAIVFAVSVWDYDRQIVDYYMTWRGKSQYRDLKEHEVKSLDDEFRRVARRIDKDFKQLKRAGSTSSHSSHRSHRSSKSKSSKRDRTRSPSSPRKSRPPNIKLPPPQADLPTPPATGGTSPEPPVSATSSVISLPYLTMVRGVPRGNRVPLMVTNPDRLSMLSEVEVPLADPDTYESKHVRREQENGAPVISVIPPDSKTPTHFQIGTDSSGLAPVMKSSASVYSTETRSSGSSGSSRSDARDDLDSDWEEADMKHEFLIVLLGDKFPREGLSWHGLERNTSARSQHRSFAKNRKSPWIGPLARADEPALAQPAPHAAHSKRKSHHEHADGAYDEQTPVVPLQPLLESLGFMQHASSDPNSSISGYPSHTPSPPVIPHLALSGIASPVPSNIMHLGGYAGGGASATPRMSMNVNQAYVPAWVGQSRSTGGARHLPPPVAYSAAPYMRPGY